MLGLLIYICLVKISLSYNNPYVLAGAYTFLTSAISLVFGNEVSTVLILTVINFGIMYVFFWLLNRFEGSGAWWAIVIVFPIAMTVLNFALK